MNSKTLFYQIARQNNTTVDEVYAEIQKAIDFGIEHCDEKGQMLWKQMSRQNGKTTPEELIQYLAGQVKSCG